MKSLNTLLFICLGFYSFSQVPVINKVITDTIKPKSGSQLPEKDFGFIVNPGFEDVQTMYPLKYTGWNYSGNAFNQHVGGNLITSERVRTEMLYQKGGIGGDYWKYMPYPAGVRGQRWLGSYEKSNGDGAIGMIVSEPFRNSKKYIHFLLGGGNDYNKLYVELQIAAADYTKGITQVTKRIAALENEGNLNPVANKDGFIPLKRITPLINGEEMFRYWFDIYELTGKDKTVLAAFPPKFRIVITDSTRSAWGHINVDDFQTVDEIKDTLHIRRNAITLVADNDRPVWGFADTHAHPASQLGFGGRTVRGEIRGEMKDALSTQKCETHSGIIPTMFSSGVGARNFQHMAIAFTDPHLKEGYPTFSGWPKYSTMYHQQMYIDWIKRAYEGGQRLMCVLGVTNMFWATRAIGMGALTGIPIDDETVGLKQLEEFRQVVAENSEWMEIALSPSHARRIILSNKMAIVLGLEMDNFGNFKDENYFWKESYPMPPSNPLVPLSRDLTQAKKQLVDKIDQYYDQLGIRQVTPLHYITGVFGGTSVNGFGFSLIQNSFTNTGYELREGWDKGYYYNIAKDISLGQWVAGNFYEPIMGMKPIYFQCDPGVAPVITDPGIKDNCLKILSTRNAKGLTPRGSLMFKSLMRKGMLIDIDHASTETIEQLFNLGDSYNYPLLSSHTDPFEISYPPGNRFLIFGDDHKENYRLFGTTIFGNLRKEGHLLPQSYDRLNKIGGMSGLLLIPYRKLPFSKLQGHAVANNCDGSSKTWAQMYLYSVYKMPGKGIALSSDRGFTQFIGPRFGPHAAFKLKEETLDTLKIYLRNQQRYGQGSGVKYDRYLTDWNPLRFEFGDIDGWEEDVWKALAFWTANPGLSGENPGGHAYWANVPLSGEPGHQGRIGNFLLGLYQTNPSKLLAPGVLTGDAPWEQAVMYCLKTKTAPATLGARNNYSADYIKIIQRFYLLILPVYSLWEKMQGQNEPLRKLVNGQRDWDFNIDGLAHYGMIPDFLQDLKNVGIKIDMMVPIFSSAEEYIRMWEKAEKNKLNVKD